MDTHHPSQSQSAVAIQAGEEALARGAWDEARSAFEDALHGEESPEALEGLGMAAWWLEDDVTAIDARTGAYRLYRDRRDRRGAARVATGLAMDYFLRGEHAVANGWVQRAHRLLDGLERCPELGWLAIWEAHMALMADHNPTAAQRLAAEAAALGRSLEDTDLEMLALAYEGFALVSRGDIDEGMRRLDESATAAIAGEMNDIDATATACCCLIYACERVRDYGRAAQWCKRLSEFCERWSYQLVFSICRSHYAGTLVWRGAWAEAEAELQTAIAAFEKTRTAMAAESLVRLADLRVCQGRLDEASALLDRAESHPFRMLGGDLALVVRATLALERGDARSAVDHAERFLRAVPPDDRLELAGGLETLVQARLAADDHGGARQALDELRIIANEVATAPMRGALCFAEGLVSAATGDHESAKRHFEDAADLFDRSGSPFETARARLELARCLSALRRADAAEVQARNALEAFKRLGAAAEANRAQALLHQMEISPPRQTGEATTQEAALSRREVEVLRLVAQGLSNQEIAAQLVLSEHTVHRHVTSILRKLDLPSRTAAAAYAFRHDLL
jgi:LuxR family transcriptional regulator, maltose regulon positive regulatory protein